MSSHFEFIVAVPVAIGAAASFGLAGFLQHQAARLAPQSEPLRPRLLIDLMKMPSFRWSIVISAVGFGLQVVALSFGPLALVQPLLVTGVLFYLGFASRSLHRAPDSLLVAGALVALGGLIGFLLVARPISGRGEFTGEAALPLGVSLVAVVAACLYTATRLPEEFRSVPIAGATAVCYGVTAGLIRSLITAPDVATLFASWQLYAVIIVAPAGFLLNQNAFQEGAIGSVAVATINVGDPVVAIGVGAAWLGEDLTTGVWNTVGEILLLMLMASGVLILATRAQQVADRMRAEGLTPSEAGLGEVAG